MKNIKKGFALMLAFAMICTLMVYKNPVQAKSSMSMTVTAKTNTISIVVKNVKKSGILYGYDANDYPTNDPYKGVSKNILNKGEKIGSVKKGKTKTYKWNRYDQKGFDRLYKKYYILSGKTIVMGPIYATTISPRKKSIGFKQKTIKGIFSESNTEYISKYGKDLGAQSTTVNFNLTGMLNFSENPEDTILFKCNGKTYYINRSWVSHYDEVIKAATRLNMNVIGILVPFYTDDLSVYPQCLRYNASGKATLGTNTSNDEGRDDYIAMVEFLASRYSKSKANGYVEDYVVSNEIDVTHYFYYTNNFNVFMEEYARALRLTNLAIKKYAGNAKAVAPFTHCWNKSSAQLYNEYPKSFAPRRMIDWLAKQTNARGAYDWGIAPHPYGTSLPVSNQAYIDSASKIKKKPVLTGSYKTSPMLTISNFEVLGDYLSQSYVKYKGKQRDIFITEGGASSFHMTPLQLNEQCAAVAQIYYKLAHLKYVKMFNYYRLQDHLEEVNAGLTSGLLYDNGTKKAAYNVYKYIDTKQSRKYSNKYLKYIYFKKNGKKKLTSKNIKSWKTAMIIYDTSFNWNKKWNWKNICVR